MSFRRDPAALGHFITPERTAAPKIGGGGATKAQIHPNPQGRGPRPRWSPYRGNPYILCPLRLRQQQEWSVLAQDGDPGQDPRPLRAHHPEASPFTKRAWPNRVRPTKTAQGEVQLLSLQGHSYCAHHRTRASCGEGEP